MDNQLSHNENLLRIHIRILAKISLIFYLIFPHILFFFTVLLHPYLLFDHITWLTSYWYNPMSINIVLFLYWSPFLLVIGGVSYIARMSNISRIPSNTSLYEAITLPTIQYGPLKIILPVIEEEILDENEV